MKKYLEAIRQKQPLIHNITNYVTANDVANAILAVGASPIMADEQEEVEDIQKICQGLNINMGTLNQRTIPSMIKAGQQANRSSHPVILDPVGIGVSQLREKVAYQLLDEIHFDVIKGNISEIKKLALKQGHVKGVDASESDKISGDHLHETIAFVKDYAKAMDCIVVVTGQIDLVSDSKTCYVLSNGDAMMAKVTGTGCMLSGIITAALAASKDHPLKACVCAVSMMAIAGEIAKDNLKSGQGNATYRHLIIDSLYCLDGETLERKMKYEIR